MAQQLKPDVILGTKNLNRTTKCYEFGSPDELVSVITTCLRKSDLPNQHKDLAIALMRYANGDDKVYPTKQYDAVAAIENTSGYKNLGLKLSNFATDFGEILGPIWATRNGKAPPVSKKSPWLQLPKEGNFSNVDFFMYGVAFSAKSGKTTNTVNLSNFASVKSDSLEVQMAKIAKDNGNAISPILICNALIGAFGAKSKSIKKYFDNPNLWVKLVSELSAEYGDLATISGEAAVTSSGIGILKENSYTAKYVLPSKQVPLVSGIVESVSGKTIKLKKDDSKDTVSSKHRYVGLKIKKDGGRESSLIKRYSDYVVEVEDAINIKKNDKAVIFTDTKYQPTVKMIAGIASMALEKITSDGELLDYNELMSKFADKITFIKATLSRTKMSFSVGKISKAYLRNKNYDTRPQGIVRGGLGIQP